MLIHHRGVVVWYSWIIIWCFSLAVKLNKICRVLGFSKQSAGGYWGRLLYLSWQWFKKSRKCSYINREGACDHRSSLSLSQRLQTSLKQAVICCLSLQGIYSARHNDSSNNGFESLVCLSTLTFFFFYCYVTDTQISRGRLPCTFLTWQLFGDYPAPRGSNREGIILENIDGVSKCVHSTSKILQAKLQSEQLVSTWRVYMRFLW